jgi:hypothetical protein
LHSSFVDALSVSHAAAKGVKPSGAAIAMLAEFAAAAAPRAGM